jgi:hypothetical protein
MIDPRQTLEVKRGQNQSDTVEKIGVDRDERAISGMIIYRNFEVSTYKFFLAWERGSHDAKTAYRTGDDYRVGSFRVRGKFSREVARWHVPRRFQGQ